jgi:hypothetical protein
MIIDRASTTLAKSTSNRVRRSIAVFNSAAEHVNLTQSTVSLQIKRLELETKRPLLRRTTRTATLDSSPTIMTSEQKSQVKSP